MTRLSGQDRPDREEEDLGSEVRRLRRAAGLTQVQLAELVGVGPRLIGELERGKATIRLDSVERVLAAFGKRLAVVERRRGGDR